MIYNQRINFHNYNDEISGNLLISKVTFLYNVPAVTASDRSYTNRLLYTYIYDFATV